MKTWLYGYLVCPKCFWVMENQKEGQWVRCLNPGCELHGIIWEKPAVNLKFVRISEARKKRDATDTD